MGELLRRAVGSGVGSPWTGAGRQTSPSETCSSCRCRTDYWHGDELVALEFGEVDGNRRLIGRDRFAVGAEHKGAASHQVLDPLGRQRVPCRRAARARGSWPGWLTRPTPTVKKIDPSLERGRQRSWLPAEPRLLHLFSVDRFEFGRQPGRHRQQARKSALARAGTDARDAGMKQARRGNTGWLACRRR